jgi:hypothetical protein
MDKRTSRFIPLLKITSLTIYMLLSSHSLQLLKKQEYKQAIKAVETATSFLRRFYSIGI